MRSLLIAALVFALVAPLTAQTVIFQDDFEQSAPGPLGAPWEPQVTPGNSATVAAEAASPYDGGKQGLRLYDQSRDQSLVAAWLRLPEKLTSGTVTLEFDARVDSTESSLGAYLMAVVDKPGGGAEWWTSTGTNLGGVEQADQGRITTIAGDYSRTPVCPIEADVWYRIRQVYVIGSDVLDVYVTGPDGAERAYPKRTAWGSHPYLDRLLLGSGGYSGLGNMDADNVKITHTPGPRVQLVDPNGPPIPSPQTAGERFAAAREAADQASHGAAIRQGFWLAAFDSLTELFPDTFSSRPLSAPIRLSAARGEAASCQLLISAIREQPTITVEAGPLQGPGGASLPASQLDLWLVGYEQSGRLADRAPDREWWPEFLLPFADLRVPPGQSRALWLTVNVPRDARAGDYQGLVTLASGAERMEVRLRLHVWDFALPVRPALENDNWWCVDEYNGYDTYFDRRSLADYEENCRFLSKYRTSCALTGNDPLPDLVKITRTGPERYEFDFSQFDKYLEIAFRYGTNGWNPNMSCNSGFVAYLAGGLWFDVKGIDAVTDQEVVLVPRRQLQFANHEEWHKQLVIDINQPISRQFWKAYVAHLKAKGWLEACNFELMDENEGTDHYVAVHRALHELVPELRLMSYGAGPVSHPKAIGINGTWAPLLSRVPLEATAMAERRAAGDRVWMYVCGARKSSQRGHTADIYMSDPPLDRRILAWQCWKYNLQGFLFYANNQWKPHLDRDPAQFDFPVLPVQYWDPDNRGAVAADVGRIVYPWKQADGNYRLIPGIRLENLREGLQDFDYLYLLQQKNPEHPLLTLPPEIVEDTVAWTKDPGALLAYREKLARAIEGQ